MRSYNMPVILRGIAILHERHHQRYSNESTYDIYSSMGIMTDIKSMISLETLKVSKGVYGWL